MASYKDDPGYQPVHDQLKSKYRSMIGSAVSMVGLFLGGVFVLARDASLASNFIGSLISLSAIVPGYYLIKNAVQAGQMGANFWGQYNAKQAIKEATKEMQQESTLQQLPDVPKWQQEIAAQAAVPQSAEKTR